MTPDNEAAYAEALALLAEAEGNALCLEIERLLALPSIY
jgi:hypothetical protein